MGLLIVVVLGGIYGGIASPTEVAALGASLAILISLVSRKFTFAGLWRAGLATVRQTSMILFVIFTAKILAVTLIYFQVPAAMVAWIGAAEMTAGHIYLAIVLVYLVLGMFVDGIAMMVITIPFIVPIMTNAHMDLVWMGVVVCIMIEVGLADAAGRAQSLRAAGCDRRADARRHRRVGAVHRAAVRDGCGALLVAIDRALCATPCHGVSERPRANDRMQNAGICPAPADASEV